MQNSYSERDQEDYLHFWRLVGFYIGVAEKNNPCTSLDIAGGAIESIVVHLLHPDPRSGEVARHVLQSVAGRAPLNWSYLSHAQAARFLLDVPLSNALEIPFSLPHYIYISMIMLLLRLFSSLVLPFITIDENYSKRVIKIMRQRIETVLKPTLQTKS